MAIGAGARESIARRLAYLERIRDGLVFDGDTHPTSPELYGEALRERLARDPHYFQGRPVTPENLLADLDQAGIDLALAWQNPAVTAYGDDRERNLALLLAANRDIGRIAAAYPERFVSAGWTDPKALGLDGALEVVRVCVDEIGCPIVKLNPAQNAYPIDDPMVLRVVERIAELGAVPAFHYGGDTPYTPAEGLRRVARHLGDHPVIGVHMAGGGGHFVESEPLYQASRDLGLEQPNIFWVLSARRDAYTESDLIAYRLAGADSRMALASDAPYCRPSFCYGGYRAMLAALADGARHPDPRLREHPGLFDDQAIRGLLGRNLADLVIAADRRLLARG